MDDMTTMILDAINALREDVRDLRNVQAEGDRARSRARDENAGEFRQIKDGILEIKGKQDMTNGRVTRAEVRLDKLEENDNIHAATAGAIRSEVAQLRQEIRPLVEDIKPLVQEIRPLVDRSQRWRRVRALAARPFVKAAAIAFGLVVTAIVNHYL